jgi:folate-binding protein YgfZ
MNSYLRRSCLLTHNFLSYRAGLQSIRQTRLFSSTHNDNFLSSKGKAQLSQRRLVSVAGKDAARLLQGLITNNIETLVSENLPGFYSAFLNSHGRLLTDAFIYRIPSSYKEEGREGFWIELDNTLVDVLCQYLRRHKLRSDVVVKPLDASKFQVWVAWTDNKTIETNSKYDPYSNVIQLIDPRLPNFATRFLVPTSAFLQKSIPEAFSILPQATERDYILRRCLWGLTDGHKGMSDGRALPHEYNLDVDNAIDFRKGCYIGQELTIRTQHQGVVRKRILPVMAYPSGSPAPSTMVYTATDQGPKGEDIETGRKIKRLLSTPNSSTETKSSRRRNDVAGTWIEGVGNVGLALCRLEMMTNVHISADQDATSFTQGAEFELESVGQQEILKVKAFVPSWLRAQIDPRQD